MLPQLRETFGVWIMNTQTSALKMQETGNSQTPGWISHLLIIWFVSSGKLL